MIGIEIKEQRKLAIKNWLVNAQFPFNRCVTIGIAVNGGTALCNSRMRAISYETNGFRNNNKMRKSSGNIKFFMVTNFAISVICSDTLSVGLVNRFPPRMIINNGIVIPPRRVKMDRTIFGT
jgi:hypothetical protein